MTRHSFILIAVSAIGIGGCAEDPEVTHARKIHAEFGIPDDMYDVQVAAVNDAIVANHPHFTEGRSRSPTLNVDALDFMIGHRTDEFADVFAAAGNPIEIEHAELLYGKRVADWMRKTARERDPNSLDFYLLYTRIGLTFGFEGQADYLAIATEDGEIIGWELDSITAY